LSRSTVFGILEKFILLGTVVFDHPVHILGCYMLCYQYSRVVQVSPPVLCFAQTASSSSIDLDFCLQGCDYKIVGTRVMGN